MDSRDNWIMLVIVMSLMALVLFGGYYGNKAKCLRQWEHSGMKAEFRPFQGCLITLKDGRKIPASNYREL